jgi:hypothetical protein
MTAVPRGLFGPNYDGLADPEAFTARERQARSTDDLTASREAYRSPSFVVVRLRKAFDRALGRG